MSLEERNNADAARSLSFLRYVEEKKLNYIWFYSSYKSEADTWECIGKCLDQGIEICLPKVSGEGEMDFYAISGKSDVAPGAFGIMEPDENCKKVSMIDRIPDLVVLPGAAFDLMGHRIGYGKGYYDRYFANCRDMEQRPLFAAFCYDMQVLPEIPCQPHDICADLLFTESQCISIV